MVNWAGSHDYHIALVNDAHHDWDSSPDQTELSGRRPSQTGAKEENQFVANQYRLDALAYSRQNGFEGRLHRDLCANQSALM